MQCAEIHAFIPEADTLTGQVYLKVDSMEDFI